MSTIAVMHLIDSLAAGGSERVAVNLANNLPRERYHAHLCATRQGGPLSTLVQPHVQLLVLRRGARFDLAAIWRLAAYVRAHRIRVLHAHSSSIFLAAVVSLLPPYPRVIWHDHFGRAGLATRSVPLYGLAMRRAAAVIAVSSQLVDWARRKLRVSASRIWKIPSFVDEHTPRGELPALPGVAGKRIVCVANLRPQKDHITLLTAMSVVREQVPDAHLLLVGSAVDQAYLGRVSAEVARLGLSENVSLLGHRSDVYDILGACDVGVLSSASEAFPLSLLEYGVSGLATVTTAVGECAEVLDRGAAGLLVPPGAPDDLAVALLSLLRSPSQRKTLADRLRARVQERYSLQSSVEQVCRVYEHILNVGQDGARNRALTRV
ncbi:MAG: glycosyltransferase [Chloroflexia bacterium]